MASRKKTTRLVRTPMIDALRLEELRAMPYEQYLQTPEWLRRRENAYRRAGYRCQLCNGKGPLHAHHRTYERLGCELPADVICLCKGCHALFHRHRWLVRHRKDM